jgi:glycosyltransferase involved in cell wall biosynthesis
MEIYRRANKRLYVYAYGADHRLREKTLALGKWTFCSECPEVGKFCVCDDTGGGEMLRTIREHASAVIAHGLSMNIIPGARNIPYIAVDVKALSPNPPPPVRNKLVVGHFPNHTYFKGTKYLEIAVQNLRRQGFDVEILKLSGKPNSEIIEAMGEIDVLVDQLVSGSFGQTAIEAMALGCPVICYLHAGVGIADAGSCPVIEANPDTIQGVLRNLMLDRSTLMQARVAGPSYVRRNYSIESLGWHLANLYADTGGLPEELQSEIKARAKELRFPDGCGSS